MKGKDIALLVTGAILGGMVIFWLMLAGSLFSGPRRTTPKIAGQSIPREKFQIDFTKRYNLFLETYGKLSMVYSNCVIRGFTGDAPDESSSYSRGYYFDTWLVVQLSDGRLVYLPQNSVKWIEEAATDK